MNKILSPTYYYLFTGIIFLSTAIRNIFAFEVLLEWILFLCLIVGIIVSYNARVVWFAYYNYILILLYNPLFLVYHNIEYSYLIDICVGISFFLMGLHWKRYVIST